MVRSEIPSGFLVVGLGASAGGLDAFKTFLELIPADSGMALVLLQHLDPRRESQLAELLAPHTSMALVQARNDLRIEPDHVYVIPPDAAMTIVGGQLSLKAIGAQVPRMPIDTFLRSLATDCGERAIGVVLTGTGTDGTLGLKEIKDKDGLAIAQDPDDAAYDGMPRSAIASGMVDLILPLREIPNALVGFAQQKNSLSSPALAERVRSDLDKIIAYLRSATAHNFAPYKPGTLQRRIERRMAITQHRGQKRVVIWRNDGKGVFEPHEVGRGRESHLGTRVHDLDGDGDPDIVSIGYDDDDHLWLWRNDAIDIKGRNVHVEDAGAAGSEQPGLLSQLKRILAGITN